MIHFIFHRLTDMSKKYPYQNPDAEEASGLTKKMQERMKIMKRNVLNEEEGQIKVSDIEKFIIGDLLDIRDGNISLLSNSPVNSPMRW